MINVVITDNEEDILALTGMESEGDLWDVGFNLDDWDICFCADKPLHVEESYIDEDDGEKRIYIRMTEEQFREVFEEYKFEE